jgi:hypothetical protein
VRSASVTGQHGSQATFGGPESVVDARVTEVGNQASVRDQSYRPPGHGAQRCGCAVRRPRLGGALLGLGINLGGRSTGDPLQAANSPEVVEFNGGSIDRWTEAVNSSGTANAEEVAAV